MITWELVCTAKWAVEEHGAVCHRCRQEEGCAIVERLTALADHAMGRWEDQLIQRYSA